jgi:hypothetical protein
LDPRYRVKNPQCCGSGMFIPDPDFYSFRIPDLESRISDPGSRIPDLGSRISDPGSRIPDAKIATKERGEKNFVIPFYIASNVTKLNIIVVLKS